MPMEQITSRQNPLMTRVRKLQKNRAARCAAGEYLGDGVKLLEEALKNHAPLTAVIASFGVDLPPIPEGVRCVAVPEEVMASISPMEAPQGVLFLARRPDTAPPEKLTGQRYLVLDGVQDPGNVGTIWRTADAFGADGLILLNGCADPYGPKTVRATMGAAFRLPVWEMKEEELMRLLEAANIPLLGTALREDTEDIRGCDLSRAAVAIGNEGRGLSQSVLAQCGKTLRIPMRERCESLNAASAAAVVLWEMTRGV